MVNTPSNSENIKKVPLSVTAPGTGNTPEKFEIGFGEGGPVLDLRTLTSGQVDDVTSAADWAAVLN